MMVNAPYILLLEENFQSEVLHSLQPVLVDCWASWCGSLGRNNPFLDELFTEFAGRIKIGRLNVAESANLAAQYRVRAVPTLLLFHNGHVQCCMTGSISKQSLVQQINALETNALINSRRLNNPAREVRIAGL
jgi:thioredoxin 1